MLRRSHVLLACALTLVACSSRARRTAGPPAYAGGWAPPPTAPPQPPWPAPASPWPAAWTLPGLPFAQPQPGVSLGTPRAVNVQALLANIGRSRCPPAEVSPGNWVGFDCGASSFVTRSTMFVRPHGLVTAALPESVDHRQGGLEGPMKNQGAVGTCTAVSLSTAIESGLRRSAVTEPVSAMHVWSRYGTPSVGKAGDSNIDRPLAPEATWPYDPKEACALMKRGDDDCGPAYSVQTGSGDSDPAIQAKRKTADGAGRFKLIGVERLPSTDPQALAELLAGGDDLWAVFKIQREAWHNPGAAADHVIPDHTAPDGPGHAVVLAGFRTRAGAKQFLIHNSWGPSWGDQGYAWIGEATIRKQLVQAYRVRVAAPGASPQPITPPGPPAPPAPPGPASGCPQGQGIDLFFGKCAPLCANGKPSAAGFCAPPQPTTPSGGCAPGQVIDVVSRLCSAPCSNGVAPVGGLCLPQLR